MQNQQFDLGTAFAAHPGGRLGQIHFQSILTVDGQNDVARAQSGFVTRRVLNGRHYQHLAVFGGDFHAHAEKFARGAFLHLLKFLGGEQCGMRIEPLQHPLEGAVDKFGLFDVLDVILLHHVQNLAEAPQGFVVRVRAAGAHDAAAGKKQHQSQRASRQDPQNRSHVILHGNQTRRGREQEFPAGPDSGSECGHVKARYDRSGQKAMEAGAKRP